MIQRFDLMKVYRAKRLDDALLLLSKRSSVRLENTGIISVTVEDRDRQRAADIANAMVEELDKINVEVRIYKARRARLHVESQLAATRQRLSAAEDSLAAFQAANLAIALDEQAKAAIEAVARLEAQAIELRVRKGLIESYATAENPEYRLLQKELSALEQQLGDVELTSATDLSFSKVPALAARLAQLVREVKVAETVLALLTEDYEKARLDEAKETPVVQVLDRAEPPERRAWPKRTLLVGSISAGVLVASIAFSIASDRLARFTSVEDRSRWTAVARHCGEWLRPRRRER
jgi:capsule polysaccharide export protein KpsE/RkpR